MSSAIYFNLDQSKILLSANGLKRKSRLVPSVAYKTREYGVAGSIPGQANFFPGADDSHCDRIHSFLATGQ